MPPSNTFVSDMLYASEHQCFQIHFQDIPSPRASGKSLSRMVEQLRPSPFSRALLRRTLTTAFLRSSFFSLWLAAYKRLEGSLKYQPETIQLYLDYNKEGATYRCLPLLSLGINLLWKSCLPLQGGDEGLMLPFYFGGAYVLLFCCPSWLVKGKFSLLGGRGALLTGPSLTHGQPPITKIVERGRASNKELVYLLKELPGGFSRHQQQYLTGPARRAH